jgi:hypothetical protein
MLTSVCVTVLLLVAAPHARGQGSWKLLLPDNGSESQCPSECTQCGAEAAAHYADRMLALGLNWIAFDTQETGGPQPQVPRSLMRQESPACGDANDTSIVNFGISPASLGAFLVLSTALGPERQVLSPVLQFLRSPFVNGLSGLPLRAAGASWWYAPTGDLTILPAALQGYLVSTVARAANPNNTAYPLGQPTLRVTMQVAVGLLHFGLTSPVASSNFADALGAVSGALSTARIASRGRLVIPEFAMPANEPSDNFFTGTESIGWLNLVANAVQLSNVQGVINGDLMEWLQTVTSQQVGSSLCQFIQLEGYVPYSVTETSAGVIGVSDRQYHPRSNIVFAAALAQAGILDNICGTGTAGSVLKHVAIQSGIQRSDVTDFTTSAFIANSEGNADTALTVLMSMAIDSVVNVSSPSQTTSELRTLQANLAPYTRTCVEDSPQDTRLALLDEPSLPSCRGLYESLEATVLYLCTRSTPYPNIFIVPVVTTPSPQASTGAPPPDTEPQTENHVLYIVVGVAVVCVLLLSIGVLLFARRRRSRNVALASEAQRILPRAPPDRNVGFF